jgi:RNA-directed DNA polymerase
VRSVTETQGKKTPGVDGSIWSTPAATQEAARLRQKDRHPPLPWRRVSMPKANGQQRPLGMPARQDRATQTLHGLALEPIAAHLADPHASGVRRERSTADAIGQWSLTLATRDSPAWVLAGAMRACGDRISHPWRLPQVPRATGMLAKGLKAGDLERKPFHATEEGRPQGGTSSPVLCHRT